MAILYYWKAYRTDGAELCAGWSTVAGNLLKTAAKAKQAAIRVIKHSGHTGKIRIDIHDNLCFGQLVESVEHNFR